MIKIHTAGITLFIIATAFVAMGVLQLMENYR